MLFPTSAQDSPRGLPDANDLCLGLQSLSLAGWDQPWSTQDADSSAQSSAHSGECQARGAGGGGARVASGGARSNSCSFPSASPTAHAQHGAVLQEMEMLAECAGQMAARKGRHSSSLTLTDSLELFVCTWVALRKVPKASASCRGDPDKPPGAQACRRDDEAKHFGAGEGTSGLITGGLASVSLCL